MNLRIYNGCFWLGYWLSRFNMKRDNPVSNPYRKICPEWAGWDAAINGVTV